MDDDIAKAIRLAEDELRKEPALTEYTPPLKERIANYFMGDSRPSPERRQHAKDIADLAYFVPGVGEAMAGDRIGRDIRSGDYLDAAKAILGVLPGASAALGRTAVRAAPPIAPRVGKKDGGAFDVLPLREDDSGIHFDSNAGVLGSMKRAFTAPHDAMTGELDPNSDEGIKRAVDLAGMITGGAAGGTAPEGALASGIIRREPIIGYHDSSKIIDRFTHPEVTGYGATTASHVFGPTTNSALHNRIAELGSQQMEGVPTHSRYETPPARKALEAYDARPGAPLGYAQEQARAATKKQPREYWNEAASIIQSPPGYTYKAALDIDPEKMVDFNRSFRNNPKAYEALLGTIPDLNYELDDYGVGHVLWTMRNAAELRALERGEDPLLARQDYTRKVTNRLKEAGYQGNVYRPRMETGLLNKDDTYYHVYDPDRIRMLDRYAQGGSVVDDALRVAHNTSVPRPRQDIAPTLDLSDDDIKLVDRVHRAYGGLSDERTHRESGGGFDYNNSMRLYYDLINSGRMTPAVAQGFSANFSHESNKGNQINPAAHENNQKEGRGGYGEGQWTGDRRKDFLNYAADTGQDWKQHDTNVNYLLNDINHGYEKKMFDKHIANSPTGDAATRNVEKFYERAGVPAMGARLQHSQRIGDIAQAGNPFANKNLASYSLPPQTPPSAVAKNDVPLPPPSPRAGPPDAPPPPAMNTSPVVAQDRPVDTPAPVMADMPPAPELQIDPAAGSFDVIGNLSRGGMIEDALRLARRRMR